MVFTHQSAVRCRNHFVVCFRVYPEDLTASSVLANDSNEFRANDHPYYAADDDVTMNQGRLS